MPVAQDKMFTQATIEKGTFDDEERTFVAWASKPVLDRDGEIIANDAWDTTNFEKNKVLLWAHDYSKPPVGKVLWLKQQKNGLKFKPKFAPTEMGQELYMLYKEAFLNTFSVGFIPKDFEEDEEETVQFMGFFGGIFEKPVLTYTDVELLEISCVPVPSCPDALVERMAAGQIKAKGLQQAIKDTTSKTIIPFKHYSLDPEDATWDGPAERRDADITDLKVMSTWFDSEDPDVKSSYKLPHHRADDHNTVWRGTAAAMVALLGGRGGVDIPDDDRRGVYSHLSRHYGEFDKDPPEFKHYTEYDLKMMEKDGRDPQTYSSAGGSSSAWNGTKEELEVFMNSITGKDGEVKRLPDFSLDLSDAIFPSGLETVKTSAGKVDGGWEAVEIEERDPVEIMRQNGLAKEKDGIIPVATELWNNMMDGFAKISEKEIEQEADIEMVDAELIEVSEEEISLMVRLELENKELEESLRKLSHAYKLLNAKFEVLQGGIG